MTSSRVNTVNSLKLSVSPISKESVLNIYMPSFMNSQLDQAVGSNMNGASSSLLKFYKDNVLTQPNIQYNIQSSVYCISLTLN